MEHTLSTTNETEVGKLICHFAKTFFEKVENRRAFEKWYFDKYKVAYKWKTNKEN